MAMESHDVDLPEVSVSNFSPKPSSGVSNDYKEELIISDRPFGTSSLPVYTLDWTSRTDPYFMPATGLDFLTGVKEVLLQPTTVDLTSSSDSKFLVKIPNEETLYLGVENSTSIQRALLCSQRSFNMTFLDPNKKEAATFVRKAAITNPSTCFQQELSITIPEKSLPIGRIIQDRFTFSTVSFSILDEKNDYLFKIIASEPSHFWKLKNEAHFHVVDTDNRRVGVILHKWDNDFNDFLYHIFFPSSNTPLCHKVLLIGAALLVEYTYFKKSTFLGCFA